ncbi:MAG: NAD(+)/NADH kinase [Sciscionella sp.]|nr:NAD(+)/NADH kinase [Sciscionella sp.]
MRALLIVNPHATSTTAGGRDVLAHALASDAKLEVVHTGHRGHATEAAARAATDGVDLVVVHGGDGTVNEAVNGMLAGGVGDAVPMIGVVPGGSANVFGRALGISTDPVEATHQLLTAIEARRWRTVGLGLADDRWFTFSAGLGWDAEVVATVDRKRTKRASQSLYTRAALINYVRQHANPPSLTVDLPGEPVLTDLRMAFVSNTDPWTYLGDRPIRLNPGCSFDGGIALFALRTLALATVLRHLRQAMASEPRTHGKHLVRRDDVDWIVASSPRPVLLQVDGDLVGERGTVTFRRVPRALRVAI